MESLESKLDRLSPEQRKETEDFVDFLLSREDHPYSPPETPCDHSTVQNVTPPLLSLINPATLEETRSVRIQDLARTEDNADMTTRDMAAPVPFHEVGVAIQDRISRDYMDYGQFEQPSSPAAEAVKKVKRKIIAREQEEKPRHLLDWVD
jgi:hypothetical protein